MNNALSKLKSRNIIVSRLGRPGDYRLQLKSFALWIKSYAKAKEVHISRMAPDAV